jgi:hypothetical protein
MKFARNAADFNSSMECGATAARWLRMAARFGQRRMGGCRPGAHRLLSTEQNTRHFSSHDDATNQPSCGPNRTRAVREVPSTKRLPALTPSLPRWGIDFKPKTRKILGNISLRIKFLKLGGVFVRFRTGFRAHTTVKAARRPKNGASVRSVAVSRNQGMRIVALGIHFATGGSPATFQLNGWSILPGGVISIENSGFSAFLSGSF